MREAPRQIAICAAAPSGAHPARNRATSTTTSPPVTTLTSLAYSLNRAPGAEPERSANIPGVGDGESLEKRGACWRRNSWEKRPRSRERTSAGTWNPSLQLTTRALVLTHLVRPTARSKRFTPASPPKSGRMRRFASRRPTCRAPYEGGGVLSAGLSLSVILVSSHLFVLIFRD